jgi:teichuronic acid biosynthesis glycosyltransferase TuaH
VIPFGCDVELFGRARSATPASDVALEAPIALLMGTLNERLDLGILDAVAGAGISLLIVGPQSPRFASPAFDALVGVPGVQWVGAKDFRDLPAYVAHASVGLVPYTHSKFNEGSFPLKTLEYLAAGVPVVATDLPAIRWLGSPDVAVEEEPEAFARRVAELTTAGPDAALTVRRTEFASQHSWAARAHEFATLAGIIP